MSDDLVKRLHSFDCITMDNCGKELRREAADRIEELEAHLETSEEIGRAFEEDAGQLREKLTKAVEALENISDTDPDSGTEWFHTFAHVILAELNYDERSEKKGETDA